MEVKKDGKVLYDGEIISNLTDLLIEEGTYEFNVYKTVSESFITNVEYNNRFTLVISKHVDIEISKLELKQGDYISLIISNIRDEDNIKITSTIPNNLNIECYFETNSCNAYIPVAYDTKLDTYKINVSNNDLVIKEFDITVLEETYMQKQIEYKREIFKEFQKFYTSSATSELNKVLTDMKKSVLVDKHFEDQFILPVTGQTITSYGTNVKLVETETMNSEKPNEISFVNMGIDYEANYNTPVYATASGKVVVAKNLTGKGNFIVIDHGMGIYSTYAHLNSFNIQEGELVKQGDLIGNVGDTGYTVTALLEFEIIINGVYVNPLYFVKEQ